ncbi:hypothetical protein J437_LFUL019603 [Ladona fulva]|uniref:Uncharacterized protein n=1 Tax=Ladona fulva TaxID=123851 RepID=A0A8K0KTF8_LADFU|nr:hypothetical protein J437_LFUL019603 [Ladona fulva]
MKHAKERYLAVCPSEGDERIVSGSDDFTMIMWQPEKDKKPIVKPIYKSDDKSIIFNYQTISNISIIPIIFDGSDVLIEVFSGAPQGAHLAPLPFTVCKLFDISFQLLSLSPFCCSVDRTSAAD